MNGQETIIQKISRGIRRSAEQHQLPLWATITLVLLPFLLTLLLSLFSRPFFYDLHPYLWGEGKIVETAQFIFFLIAVGLSLVVSWRTAVLGEAGFIRAFYLAFGLVAFFIAGEEVAWGQTVLNFQTPAPLQALNAQNEFTFHNLGPLQARSDLLNLLFAAAGWVGLVLHRRRRWRKISLPALLRPWFGLILLLAIFGIGFDLALGDQPLDYPEQYIFHIQTETTELLIAMVAVLVPWLNDRAYFARYMQRALPPDPTFPDHLALFPLKPSYTWIALLSGLGCIVWLVLIPGEAASATFLGLSRPRLLMVVANLVLLLLIGILHWRSIHHPAWRDRTSRRLNRRVMKPGVLWALIGAAGLSTFLSSLALVLTYTQNDPSLAAILHRLAPWTTWLLVLSLEALLLLLPRQLPLARWHLAHAEASPEESDPFESVPGT